MPKVKKVKEVWTKGPSKYESEVEFHNFFDIETSVEDAIKKGFIDFSHRIFTSEFYEFLGDPRDKVALEIGFGGGRLLNAASNYFGKVIGVDIHESFDRTQKILEREGCKNFELIHRDNIESIPSGSVDFVFSFIVFQHFSNWAEAEFYINQIERLLSPNGCGTIYFGINDRNPSLDYLESGEYWEERGYSLVVTPNFARERLSKKFTITGVGRTRKSLWGEHRNKPSAQFYINFTNGKK